jgi:hypothetical protein
MKLRKFLLLTIVLMVQASAFAGAGAIEAEPTPIMLLSYWGYIALLPLMLVAFVVNGWLIRWKR